MLQDNEHYEERSREGFLGLLQPWMQGSHRGGKWIILLLQIYHPLSLGCWEQPFLFPFWTAPWVDVQVVPAGFRRCPWSRLRRLVLKAPKQIAEDLHAILAALLHDLFARGILTVYMVFDAGEWQLFIVGFPLCPRAFPLPRVHFNPDLAFNSSQYFLKK